MKYFKIYLIILLSTVISFYGCNENSDAVRQQAKESLEVSATSPAVSTPSATTPPAEPKQNADGVWHYICNKGCAGGGGKGDVCATCGTALAHNTAYHSNSNANSTPTTNPITPSATTPAVTPPPAVEPKQNAAGVWHYICNKGCAGGGGNGDVCATCGATLAHNTAYHN